MIRDSGLGNPRFAPLSQPLYHRGQKQRAKTGSMWETYGEIIRWECVRFICGKDWQMRIIWCGGHAWFSFGAVGGRTLAFQRKVPEFTPDLCNHFIRLVTRMVNAL